MHFHRLRPAQIAARKQQLPVAYIGLGILEWHGLHNPYGLDGLKADGIAARLARELGGTVMPPFYWGDHRAEICELHLDGQFPQTALQLSPYAATAGAGREGEWNPADAMSAALGTERDAFAKQGQRAAARGGWRLWQELVIQMLFQVEAYGFKAIVAIPGHYPLLEPLEQAIAAYQAEGGSCTPFILKDNLFSRDGNGDHAAAYETSLLMALDPGTVDLAVLPADPAEPLAGVALGEDPRAAASAAYGEQALSQAVAYMRAQLQASGLL